MKGHQEIINEKNKEIELLEKNYKSLHADYLYFKNLFNGCYEERKPLLNINEELQQAKEKLKDQAKDIKTINLALNLACNDVTALKETEGKYYLAVERIKELTRTQS